MSNIVQDKICNDKKIVNDVLSVSNSRLLIITENSEDIIDYSSKIPNSAPFQTKNIRDSVKKFTSGEVKCLVLDKSTVENGLYLPCITHVIIFGDVSQQIWVRVNSCQPTEIYQLF